MAEMILHLAVSMMELDSLTMCFLIQKGKLNRNMKKFHTIQ